MSQWPLVHPTGVPPGPSGCRRTIDSRSPDDPRTPCVRVPDPFPCPVIRRGRPGVDKVLSYLRPWVTGRGEGHRDHLVGGREVTSPVGEGGHLRRDSPRVVWNPCLNRSYSRTLGSRARPRSRAERSGPSGAVTTSPGNLVSRPTSDTGDERTLPQPCKVNP